MPDSVDLRLARAAGTDDANAVRAFTWACELDVRARKPGNVSLASPGHRMRAGLFLQSADAAAPGLCRIGEAVGGRIESAVRATWAAVHCNTNLGIVLLCAPLVAAWQGRDGDTLRLSLARILEGLDIDDARAAYRAIALAQPAGLGTAAQQDVAQLPTVDLRAAMALAADRDRIARQYAQDYADVFDTGLASFANAYRDALHCGDDARFAAVRAMQCAFLEFLAEAPDSHIARKHGDALAHCVMAETRPWRDRARRGAALDADPAFAAWDESLKERGLNPGTCADLSVATALAWALDAGDSTAPPTR
jgi:triphosphoribosyl-dephospho-CoA synthase